MLYPGKFHKVQKHGSWYLGGSGAAYVVQGAHDFTAELVAGDTENVPAALSTWLRGLSGDEDARADLLLVGGNQPDVFLLDTDGFLSAVGGNTALGSGSDFALGAMYAGRDAEDAVWAAVCYDIYSGGPVHTEVIPGP